MSLHTSTGTPTKAQQRRFEAIKLETGCVCCRLSNATYVQPEIHHLLSGGRRRGHDLTIGLCGWHHRGVASQDTTSAWLRQYAGPSLAHGSKPFHAHFGSDEVLLAEQERLLCRVGFKKME